VEVCHVYDIAIADRQAANARADKIRQAAAAKATATNDKNQRGANCSLGIGSVHQHLSRVPRVH